MDRQFVEIRTEGYEQLAATVTPYTPEVSEKITGVPAEQIRAIARAYGQAERAMIFWGMGDSQHTTGTDNARCLISLALLTGNVGRPGQVYIRTRPKQRAGGLGCGTHPLRLHRLPIGGRLRGAREFEQAWGVALDPNPGLTVVEIMHEVGKGISKA